VLDILPVETVAFNLVDRGYLDFGRLLVLHQSDAFLHPYQLSRTRFWDPESGQTLVFLTNNTVKTQIWCTVAAYVLIIFANSRSFIWMPRPTLCYRLGQSLWPDKCPASKLSGCKRSISKFHCFNQLNLICEFLNRTIFSLHIFFILKHFCVLPITCVGITQSIDIMPAKLHHHTLSLQYA
jgi:hypothetical protein